MRAFGVADYAALHPRPVPCIVCAVQPRGLAGSGCGLCVGPGHGDPVVAAVTQGVARHWRGARADVGLDRVRLSRRLLLADQPRRAGLRRIVRAARLVPDPRRRWRQAVVWLTGRSARIRRMDLGALFRTALSAGRHGRRPALSGAADVRHHALPGHAVHFRPVAAHHGPRAASIAGSPPSSGR